MTKEEQVDAQNRESTRTALALREQRINQARIDRPAAIRSRIETISGILQMTAVDLRHYAQALQELADTAKKLPDVLREDDSSIVDKARKFGPDFAVLHVSLPKAATLFVSLLDERDSLFLEFQRLQQSNGS